MWIKLLYMLLLHRNRLWGRPEIAGIVEDDILAVWHQTKEYSGITYKFFRQYYKGKKKAIAYQLKNLVIYDKPLTLEEIGVSCAPQSYRYISAMT